MNTTVSLIVLERFIEIDKNTGCWNYNRPQKGRYPVVGYNKKKYPFHRLSWILTNGEIPKGLYVCHKCDNTKCGNPEHLFLGTQFDNMRDMVDKGRGPDTKGNKNPRAKLTDKEVEEIRRLYIEGCTRKDLSKTFSTPMSTIHNILRGDTWKHLDYVAPRRMPASKKLTKEIEQKIKEIRATTKLSQDKIAEMVGISQAVVSRVLLGQVKGW